MTTTRGSSDLPRFSVPKLPDETTDLARVSPSTTMRNGVPNATGQTGQTGQTGTTQGTTPTPGATASTPGATASTPGATASTPAPAPTPAPETGVTSVTSSAQPPDQHITGRAASDSERRAVIDQAMRELQTERSDDLSELRDQIQGQINERRQARAVIEAEKSRVLKAMAELAALPAGAKLVPPFLPADVLAKQAAPGTSPKDFEIDGQKLTLPPDIYNTPGFQKALDALANVRALAPTTGASQSCGASVTNELVSNAFQFLATQAVLGANTHMSYSDFVKALGDYGISATANQEDGVIGGSVTLEGGRKVNDGISDGKLDSKDMEWTKASAALAEAIGVSATDLNINKADFDKEYGQISKLLSDDNFNPADNDALVEVLMIASVLERAGVAVDGALTTRLDLERYMAKLNTQEAGIGADMQKLNDQLVHVLQSIGIEKPRVTFANLEEPAPGSNETSRSNRNQQGTSNSNQTGRGNSSGITASSLRSNSQAVTSSDVAERTGRASTSSTAAEGTSFVRRQAGLLAEALRDEHRLKMKLLDIDLGPQTPGALARNQTEAWNTLGELRSINMDRKLPVMRELANYIASNREVLTGMHGPAAAEAAPSGRGSDRSR